MAWWGRFYLASCVVSLVGLIASHEPASAAQIDCDCFACDGYNTPCPLCLEEMKEQTVEAGEATAPEGSSGVFPQPLPETQELLTNPTLPPADDSAPQLAFSEQSAAFGGRRFSVPNQIGDNFGSGGTRYCLIRRFELEDVLGFSFAGGGVSPILFEAGPDKAPDDFISVGQPFDSNGDGLTDAVAISEPFVESNLPSAAAPFEFNGDTSVANVTEPPIGTGFENFNVVYEYKTVVILPDPGAGGAVVGRMKIAENSSPLPQSRVYFNYSHFDNVPLTRRGVDVNRFSPGFERAFANGLMSCEVRVPFAATLDSNIALDGASEFSNLELGNLFVATKVLLWSGRDSVLSAGVALTLPTADDMLVRFGGTPLLRVKNESVHVMPFLGWGHQRGRFFNTTFVQLDFDANGNTVLFDPTGNGLERSGVVQDESYLYVDFSVGYWLWRTQDYSRNVTGVAPICELHWNRSLQDSDFIERDGFQLGESRERTQILNAVIGTYFRLGSRADMTLGFTTPIGNRSDQQFDGELRAIFNRYF